MILTSSRYFQCKCIFSTVPSKTPRLPRSRKAFILKPSFLNMNLSSSVILSGSGCLSDGLKNSSTFDRACSAFISFLSTKASLFSSLLTRLACLVNSASLSIFAFSCLSTLLPHLAFASNVSCSVPAALSCSVSTVEVADPKEVTRITDAEAFIRASSSLSCKVFTSLSLSNNASVTSADKKSFPR
uniref:Uncharacterized protein n=1 Tax=Opuntia streptacantha TaxID=393608 RepID=A0A7C8ZJT0_OPUST